MTDGSLEPFALRRWLAGLAGCAARDLALAREDHKFAGEHIYWYERHGEGVGQIHVVESPRHNRGEIDDSHLVLIGFLPGRSEAETLDLPHGQDVRP